MELEPIPLNVDLSTYSCIVAQGGDKVYKDECVFCFSSPVSFKQVFYILLHSASEKKKKNTIRITKKWSNKLKNFIFATPHKSGMLWASSQN